ncbi:MAG: hypothetical protein IKA88_01015 [Clostridia bacterium]|nr:hypothetical protein [Clostridia bacterium]
MFDYTKAALTQITKDFKKLCYILNVVTQTLYIAYLVFALATQKGVFAANVTLLSIASAYFVFFLIMTNRDANKLKKRVKTVFKRSKQVINFFTLGVIFYGIYVTAGNVTPMSVLFAAFMVVSWVLQIIFELILYVILNRLQLFKEALDADVENLKKPVTTVGNFFKRMAGKEIEEKEPTKNRAFLDQKVSEAKAERAEKKQREKDGRKERKKQEKTDRKQAKMDAKTEKRRLKNSVETELAQADETEE